MKTLLIFPPQWTPLSPHYSLTSIAAQLKKHGFETKVKDLNIKFYNDILNKKYLENSISKIDEEQNKAFEAFNREYSKDKDKSQYSESFHQNLYKLSKIKTFKENKSNLLKTIPDKIEEAVNCFKDKERFYSAGDLIESMGIINSALEIISLPYLPLELSFSDSYNRFVKLSYQSIKSAVENEATNIYLDYYNSILDEILDDDYDLIGISLNSNSQLVPCFTLGKLLKQKSKAKISIGGNFISRVIDGFTQNPEFFDIFADYLNYEEGEVPTLRLREFVSGKINIEDVPNLVYKKDNKVIVNEKCEPMLLNNIPRQDLSDYNLEDYFLPEIVLPVASSKGCYWGKCSFCDQYYGQKLNVKDVDILVNQLKHLKEDYGIENFEFIDESIAPGYMKQFSSKLIKEGLDIGWFCDARLEKNFTKETLKEAHKAGLKMVLWGLESGSKKVMLDINKGIDIDSRLDIMKNANENDIWNFAFIFFGFPTETKEDAQMTIDMIKNNTDIIHSYGRSIFTMGSYSKLMENPQKYGITKFYHDGFELSPTYYYETSIGLNQQEVSQMADLCTIECKKAYGNPLWMYLSYREILYLYIKKYGAKKVAMMKIK